jgi:hypothetical protein
VEPLDLAGRGRRANRGEQVTDPVLAADPVEQDLMSRAGGTPTEHATVVGEHALGNPVGAKGLGEGLADRAGGGPWHRVSEDAEPGVVVEPGQDLHGRAAFQARLHDVELPQLHRAGPLPPEVVRPLAPSGPGLDEPGADQDSVDARSRGNRVGAFARELVREAPRSPARVLPAELDHLQLGASRGSVRTAPRTLGAIDQAGHPTLPVPPEPVVQALSGDAVAAGDLGHGPLPVQHFLHRVVALLHDPQLHQHDPDLLPRAAMATRAGRAPVSNIWWSCQRSGGTA